MRLFFFTSDPRPSTPERPFVNYLLATGMKVQSITNIFSLPFSPYFVLLSGNQLATIQVASESLFRVAIVEHNTRKHCELTISGRGPV